MGVGVQYVESGLPRPQEHPPPELLGDGDVPQGLSIQGARRGLYHFPYQERRPPLRALPASAEEEGDLLPAGVTQEMVAQALEVLATDAQLDPGPGRHRSHVSVRPSLGSPQQGTTLASTIRERDTQRPRRRPSISAKMVAYSPISVRRLSPLVTSALGCHPRRARCAQSQAQSLSPKGLRPPWPWK
jgi:hypothetical protein